MIFMYINMEGEISVFPFIYTLTFVAIALALAFVGFNFFKLKRLSEGTKEMREISNIIREGANTFMTTIYKRIVPITIGIAILLSLFIEKFAGLTFILGALMSSAACITGMNGAALCSIRVTNCARISKENALGKTNKVALMGGAIGGLSVPGFGLLGLIVLYLVIGGAKVGVHSTGIIPILNCNPTVMWLSTYSLGCSLIAMFNRVAGGNFTKSADIGSDIIGKIKMKLPEDCAAIPSTIADFVGDRVNDIAANCSDLLESFIATIVACFMIAVTINNGDQELFNATCLYPIALAGVGLLSSIIGLAYVLIHKPTDKPSRELDMVTYIAAGLTILLSILFSWLIFKDQNLYSNFKLGWFSPCLSSILGIASGVAIGKITEYYTGLKQKPVKELAKMATEGDSSFVISKGDAIGNRSCFLPIVVIAISLLASGLLAGVYGVATASLGMLSFVAATVAIDAFGPIADNAGGAAESCKLNESVREITDELDALGNTTAAIGKGFAIGSAAFATVSLIFAYVGSYSQIAEPVLNIASFAVIAGALVGGALVALFSGKLTDNTIDGSFKMAKENEEQLNQPGVILEDNTINPEFKPDYNKCIRISTENGLKHMLAPSLLAMLAPLICGLLFGPEFVGGVLIGATIVAIPQAIFNGNSGGAFDNGKKYIECGLPIDGQVYAKGSDAHSAAVSGDTVGDVRKDVVGVCLDILIKMMGTVANTLAPLFVSFHIF